MAVESLKRKSDFKDELDSRKKRQNTSDVRKLPSSIELDRITSTTSLYRSTQFHGLLTSLLLDVSPPSSSSHHHQQVQSVLHSLYTFLTDLPSSPPTHPLEAASKLSEAGIQVHWPSPIPTSETKYKFGFEPPSREGIYIVGSYAGSGSKTGSGGTMVRSREGKFVIDLVVEIPSSLIQEKDYLNSRIFHLRTYYLSYIASHLASSPSSLGKDERVKVMYDTPNGDLRRTCLLIIPETETETPSSFSIKLIPSLPSPSPIPSSRLSPTYNSLRLHSSPTNPGTQPSPTPHYNSHLAHLSLPKPLLVIFHNLSKQIPAFGDAIRLLKIWSAQRGYCRPSLSTSISTPSAPTVTSNPIPASNLDSRKDGIGSGSKTGWDLLDFEPGQSIIWSTLISALVFGEEPLPPPPPTNTSSQTQSEKKNILKSTSKNKNILRPLQIGHGLSSYQLFRAVLDLLATRNFIENPLLVKPPSEGHVDCFPKHHWSTHSAQSQPPILVEPTGRYNVLDGLSSGVLDLMSVDARNTLNTLNRPSDPDKDTEADIFQETFTKDWRQPNERFDAYFEINLSSATLPPNITKEQDLGSRHAYLLSRIYHTLNEGLSNRISSLVFLSPHSSHSSTSHCLNSPPLPLFQNLGIGIVFNPTEAFRLVDRGPIPLSEDENTSPSEESKAFKQLWGPKAELRRFKDGVIQESVVWELPTGMDSYTARERIPGRIIRHLLSLHFGLRREGDVKEIFTKLDDVLCFDKSAERDLGEVQIKSSWLGALKSFESLSKLLKSLSSSSDVPLALSSIRPASPYLRYTSIFPAFPASSDGDKYQSWPTSTPPQNRYTPLIPIILQFENSTSWPDDLYAIQSVKLALLEALARSFLSSPSFTGSARVVVGSINDNLELIEWKGSDKARLEIITGEGYAFEGRIYYNREAVLLRRLLEPAKPSPSLPTPSSSSSIPNERHLAQLALHRHHQLYIHSPSHHTAILTLHHRFPTFSHTIRLAKRFLNSQLLGGSMHESVIELLVCASFFKNFHGSSGGAVGGRGGSCNLPSSGNRGFVTFLRFISEWDWTRGLDIPLYTIAKESSPSDPSFTDPTATNTFLDTSSAPDSGTAAEADALITIGTSYHLRTTLDSQGAVFTSPGCTNPGPNAVLARRITEITKTAYRHIISNTGSPNQCLLFTPSFKQYDYLVHLKPSLAVLPRSREDVQSSLRRGKEIYVNLPSSQSIPVATSDRVIRAGFDPVMFYFRDLQRTYQDITLLLTDPSHPSVIAGVWNPSLKQPRNWRVMAGYNSEPVPIDSEDMEGKKSSKKGKECEMVILNEVAILKEMERMGEGLVERIEVLGAGREEGGKDSDDEGESSSEGESNGEDKDSESGDGDEDGNEYEGEDGDGDKFEGITDREDEGSEDEDEDESD